jgi:hypothetical protein
VCTLQDIALKLTSPMSSYFPTLRLLRTFPRQYRIIRRSHHRRPSCRLPHRTSRPTTTDTYRRDNLYPLRLCHRWSRLCSDHWTRTQGHSRNGLYLDGGIQHLPPICRMGISRRDRVRQSTSQVYRCYQCLPILNHLDARESTVLHENGADRFLQTYTVPIMLPPQKAGWGAKIGELVRCDDEVSPADLDAHRILLRKYFCVMDRPHLLRLPRGKLAPRDLKPC